MELNKIPLRGISSGVGNNGAEETGGVGALPDPHLVTPALL